MSRDVIIEGRKMVERYTPDACVICGKEVQPGQLYVRAPEGPRHLGCGRGLPHDAEEFARGTADHPPPASQP
jgi:hypothetical protein